MAKESKVVITKCTEPGELYHHYPRQTGPQDAYIELDCETGSVCADWNAEVGNAVPASVWHRRRLRWAIPILTGEAANELMTDLLPLFQRVLDGYSTRWDGNNYVGQYTIDANDIIEDITDVCQGADTAYDTYDVGDAEE